MIDLIFFSNKSECLCPYRNALFVRLLGIVDLIEEVSKSTHLNWFLKYIFTKNYHLLSKKTFLVYSRLLLEMVFTLLYVRFKKIFP